MIDRLDVCPTEAGNAGFAGCTEAQGIRLVDNAVTFNEPLAFTPKHDLEKSAQGPLEATARALKAHPDFANVRIELRVSDQGSLEANQAAAEKRLAAVLKLLRKKGVGPKRISDSKAIGAVAAEGETPTTRIAIVFESAPVPVPAPAPQQAPTERKSKSRRSSP